MIFNSQQSGISDTPAVAASASISFNGFGGFVPADGDVLLIPGSGPNRFVFSSTDPGVSFPSVWVDTSSGDYVTIFNLLVNAIPSTQYSVSTPSGTAGPINLSYTPGVGGNPNAATINGYTLTTTSSQLSVNGFSGASDIVPGLPAGSGDGNYGNVNNFDGYRLPTSADDVSCTDSPLTGTGSAKNLSGAAVAGATITCYSASNDISSGMIVTRNYSGNQSGGTVQMKGDIPGGSSSCNYQGNYTGGTIDFTTHAAKNFSCVCTGGPLTFGALNFPQTTNRVERGNVYGWNNSFIGTKDDVDPHFVLPGHNTSNGPQGLPGSLALVFISADNALNGVSRGSINGASVGNGSVVVDQPDPKFVLEGNTSGGENGTLTLPDPKWHVAGDPDYGVVGALLHPQFTTADLDYVLQSITPWGNPDSQVTGRATSPSGNDTLTRAGQFGNADTPTTANATLPTANKVLRPSDGGPSGYGANGTEFIGTASSSGGGNTGSQTLNHGVFRSH